MKTKRLLLTAFTICLLVICMCFGASAESVWEYEDLSDSTVSITHYNGTDIDLTIPDTLDNKTVVSIDSMAFNSSTVQNVTIPESVSIIEYDAFYQCLDLESATILNKTVLLDESGIGANSDEDFIIKGFRDSTAEEYANNNDFIFMPLECDLPELESVTGKKGTVTVKWFEVDGADSYIIYRKSEKDTTWTKLGEATEPTYVDKTAASGIVYYYTVSAANQYGESSYDEDGLSYLWLDQPVLSSAKSNANGITVKWKKVNGADGYYLYKKTTGSWKLVKTLTALSYTDASVVYGTQYYYTVVAYKTVDGTAVRSAYDKTGLKVKHTYIPTTKIASAEVTKAGVITVKWNKVSAAESYQLYRSTKADSGYKCVSKTTSTSYVDKSATIGTTFYYKVRVVISGKTGSFSPYVKIKSSIAAPELYTSHSVTSNSITLRWYEVSGATGYTVYRKTSDSSWKRIKTLKGASTTSFTDNVTGTYYYKVYSYKTVSGTNHFSDPSKSACLKTLKKSTITVDQYRNQFTNTITWTKVSGATHYQLYYKIGENGSWTKATTVTKDVTSYNFNVKHGKYYYWKVRPIYKKDSISSIGAFSATDNLIIYYTPEVSVIMDSEKDSSCSFVLVGLTNEGSETLRVYAKDAKLIDNDYSSYDRYLTMIDADYVDAGYAVPIDYVDIAPGEFTILVFLVDGSDTWYDYKSNVRCIIQYDGVKHIAYFSNYYGFNYYDYD